jgi:hypothetical protein
MPDEFNSGDEILENLRKYYLPREDITDDILSCADGEGSPGDDEDNDEDPRVLGIFTPPHLIVLNEFVKCEGKHSWPNIEIQYLKAPIDDIEYEFSIEEISDDMPEQDSSGFEGISGEIVTKIFRNLDYDTTYMISVRVVLGTENGPWLNIPLIYKTMKSTDIPAVTGIHFNYDTVEKNKSRKIRMTVLWDEVILPSCESDVDFYVVQLWRWDMKNGVFEDDDYARKITVEAKDKDEDILCKARFIGIHKWQWWKVAIRAVRHGKRGVWAWSEPTRAADTEKPPTPINVTIDPGVKRIEFTWDQPIEKDLGTGTVSATIGTDTLTGVGTLFLSELGEGDTIWVDNYQYDVFYLDTDNPDTILYIYDTFATTFSDAFYEIEGENEDISYSQIQMADDDSFHRDHIVKKDKYVPKTHRGFKAPHRKTKYYGRVRNVDNSGNKSKWVPATLTGNSNPDVAPEGSKSDIDADTILFHIDNSAEIKVYPKQFEAMYDFDLLKWVGHAGTAPSGNQDRFDLLVKSGSGAFTSVFANDADKLIFNSGDTSGSTSAFQTISIKDGDLLEIECETIAATAGKDYQFILKIERTT